MIIAIERFKKIEEAILELAPVNIFIGTNNSGKSSFIQGVQFAISSGQTLNLKNARWYKGISRTLSLDSTDYLYAPTRHIENLYHGKKLTGSRLKGDRNTMEFKFLNEIGESNISISRGKNGGFTTTLKGKDLGDKICDINNPYCVYVPGIAGIPIEEKYEVPFAIKKSATRGDSNNYLRNILLSISNDNNKWQRFIDSINAIYIDTDVKVYFNPESSEFIDVKVINEDMTLPIDSIGTGLLQAIQVFAYIEYFDPVLILLDEPDAHIHPTKQRMLANQLYNRSTENDKLKIVFSTHSRYILEALEDKAKVFHFQQGTVIPDVKGSKVLLDIGAADADYLFSKKDLKYIIVTEDKVDNVTDKKDFIKKLIIANGLAEDNFVLHSYEGCSKVDFAKILKGFVSKQIPGIKLILHYDRDQRTDSDADIVKLKSHCEKMDIKLFLTEYSEIENYFCQPYHIMETYGLTIEESTEIYNNLIAELEVETKRKIANFIARERPKMSFNKDGKFDIATLQNNTDLMYAEHKEIVTPGKELLGKIKNYMQTQKGLDPNLILNHSSGLKCDLILGLLKEEEEEGNAST
jgi:AAA15 family ATPase/GTPase